MPVIPPAAYPLKNNAHCNKQTLGIEESSGFIFSITGRDLNFLSVSGPTDPTGSNPF